METEKIKILGFAPRWSGCAYHRIILPLSKMDNVTGQIINNIDAIIPEKYDLFLFNRINKFADGDLDKIRKTFGCRVIMDLDDYWELPIDHIYYNRYKNIDGPIIKKNIEQADLVTTTTARLAEKIYPLNKNVVIIPNGIPFGDDQFNDNKDISDKIRIFWSGSVTHLKDIEILKYPVKRLMAHSDKIKMVIGGFMATNETDRYLWESMALNFTNNLKLPFEIFPGVPPDQYINLYNNADICLIPLRGVPWDAYKSNIKILEAATKGNPVIVSAVSPYYDEPDAPVLWVKKQSDWYKHIKSLIYDKKQRIEIGQKLQKWGRQKYDLRKINEIRSATFRNIKKI